MTVTINTNVSSMIAQNNLNKNVNGLQKAMQQLATGLRINSAGDDAAGLAIAEKIKSQVGGSNKAMDNIQDAKNFINVAEGGMISVGDHMQRINELLVQAASDMYDNEGRKSILTEIKQRVLDIDTISRGSQFNGRTLLDGSLTHMVIQTGAYRDADPTRSINTLDIGPAMTNCKVTALGNTHHPAGYPAGVEGITLPPGLDPENADFGVIIPPATNGTYATSSEMGDAVRDYMSIIQASINDVSSARGLLGAYTNRLDSTYDNLAMTVENLETAKTRITDADVAKASANMVKYQILQQTTTSTLVQANQLPSIALKLLG